MVTFSRPARLISLALVLTLAVAGFTNRTAPLVYAAAPPTVTTNSASAVTNSTATLNGTVNANGASTTVTFQYGTTLSYGTTVTATPSPVTGSINTGVSKAITGLAGQTLYHYRVVGVNSSGTTYGADQTFTTGLPNATTNAASAVTDTTATLNGTVNANSLSTTVTFQYGLTVSYGTTVTATPSPVTGSSNTAVSKAITGLASQTLYHYRVVAQNASGTVYGTDRTFTTTGLPIATTNAASAVTNSTATLNGTVNANGASTTVTFQYGTTASYGTTVAATPSPVSGSTNTAVSTAITGLAAQTLYHYRVVGVNSVGTTYGNDQTFTTGLPNATTNAASAVTDSTATLNGVINAKNTSTTVTFEYGLDTSYGTTITATPSPVTGTTDTAVSTAITGLSAKTIYHYRVVGVNSFGTTNGADQTFTTGSLDDFVITVKTDLIGSSTSTQFIIPTTGSGYNYNVDCNGDGVADATAQTGNYTCNYSAAGTYAVRIQDNSSALTGFPRIYFNNSGDKQKLLTVAQWGKFKWTSMANAFYGCGNVTFSATDSPDLSSVTDMSHMFDSATVFNSNIGGWDTSHVTNMSYMFQVANTFNQNIAGWDTSHVTNMSNMFYGANMFNQNLGSWNVATLTNAAGMFTNSGLASANYDALLVGWDAQSLQTGVALDSGTFYCAGQSARAHIVATYAWTITDKGRWCPSEEFVVTVKTDKVSTGVKTFTILTTGSGYNYNVDCNGDGTLEATAQNGNYTCTYGSAGTYTVRIRDNSGTLTGFPRIYFNGTWDQAPKLLTIAQWGLNKWTSMENAFSGCSNLSITATDSPDLSGVSDMSHMFNSASTMNSDIGDWDTSHVTNMRYLFMNAGAFNQNIGSWNTSQVTDMSHLFEDATAFNQNIGSWNTGSVTTLSNMFSGATAFNQNISGWDTSQVTDMSNLFEVASVFNQPIGDWNTSKVITMSRMFAGATAFNQNIGSWDTSNVTDMTGMFQSARAFNQPIGSWNTGKVTSLQATFSSASAFNQNLAWDTHAVTDMGMMFMMATAFNGDISGWNTGNVTLMAAMFRGATAFNGNISSWDTHSVVNLGQMFYGASNFNQNIGGWDTHAVAAMNGTFYGATAFNQNIGSWNTANALNMQGMFYHATAFNQNIGGWDTGQVTNMSYMFQNASAFNRNISSWNTGSVNDMSGMFQGATAFDQNIGGWNTGNVTSMGSMFYNATAFNQNLGSWNVSSLYDATDMFYGVSLSTPNYDALLNGWGAQTLQSDVYFDGGSSQYCLSATARNTMATTYNWSITDGGVSCAPSVTTDAATLVGTNSATLNGTIGANGASTVVTFEYGLDTSYGSSVIADQSPVAAGGNTVVSKTITGLTAGVTYHYRVVGVSANGTTNGNDRTLTTTTGPTICEVTVSGNWTAVTAPCLPGDKIVILPGVTVTLNSDIELSGDLEIRGTLNPTNRTVTLTGSAAQTFSGNPLTFYNLILNKTNKTDTVTTVGKLQVTKKLTITKGKLKSASDYGDVEIGTDGALELTNDITVDGTWINDGEFIANTAQVTFDGIEPQSIGGATPTLFHKLVISPTAGVFITTTPAVTDTVVNYGVLSQTQTVDNASIHFLQISTDKYRGVDIATTDNLGQVTVVIQGNSLHCTSDADSPAHRARCFRVTLENTPANPTDMTFYTTPTEDEIATDELYVYFGSGFWFPLTATCGSEPGDPCTEAVENLDSGDNYFLIGNSNTGPTVVTLSHLDAQEASGNLAAGWLLAWLGAFALSGLWLMRKVARRQNTKTLPYPILLKFIELYLRSRMSSAPHQPEVIEVASPPYAPPPWCANSTAKRGPDRHWTAHC